MIRQIDDSKMKQTIAGDILRALPDWFGVPEAVEEYVKKCRDCPFLAAFVDEKPVGFLCLRETGDATVELMVMGVLMEYHRRGIGRELFDTAKALAASMGYAFMQVKTVRMGMYPDYDRTNRFYRAMGFREFQVIPEIWGPENPCQIYIMALF